MQDILTQTIKGGMFSLIREITRLKVAPYTSILKRRGFESRVLLPLCCQWKMKMMSRYMCTFDGRAVSRIFRAGVDSQAGEIDHRNLPFKWQKLAEFGQFTRELLVKWPNSANFLPFKRPIPVIWLTDFTFQRIVLYSMHGYSNSVIM